MGEASNAPLGSAGVSADVKIFAAPDFPQRSENPAAPELLDPVIVLKPDNSNLAYPQVKLEEEFGLELATLAAYHEHVNNNNIRVVEHPRRVAGILSDFAGGFLGREVYSAALLHDIGQTATLSQERDVYAANAKRTILRWVGKKTGEERPSYIITPGQYGGVQGDWQDTLTFIAELETVEAYSEKSRRYDIAKSDETIRILHGAEKRITQETWLEPAALLPLSDMLELLEKVQVESVLIKAAEMIDNLRFPPKNDVAIFRDMHDAESLYIPLLEIMGMDGMASALRNETYSLRLRKSGNAAYLDMANAVLADLSGQEEALGAVQTLLETLNVGDFDLDHAVRNYAKHGMKYGTIETQLPGETETIRAIWRVKSPGSLAMKLLEHHPELANALESEWRAVIAKHENLPPDIIGVTFVADDVDQLATLFTRAANAAYEDPNLQLTHGPSRKQSIQIRGTKEFRRPLVGALLLGDSTDESAAEMPRFRREDIEDKPDEGPDHYDVAKFTCQDMKGLRTEVQFLTAEARIASRLGLQAHVLYKLRDQRKIHYQRNGDSRTPLPQIEITDEDLEALIQINRRMKELREGQSGLSQEGVRHAKKIWGMISRVYLLDWGIDYPGQDQ